MSGRIAEAPEMEGVRWSRPFTLLVRDLCGWRPVGRYRTRQLAAAAAGRRGIKLEGRM